MDKINVIKTNQCGDYFLFRFKCPRCNEDHMETIESLIGKICYCQYAFDNAVLDVKYAIFTLTVGTYRKLRLSTKKIRKMYEDQEGKCAYCCKELLLNYHVEHIIPLSAGGTSSSRNLCLSCPKCNLKASSLVFLSFEKKQQYILSSKF